MFFDRGYWVRIQYNGAAMTAVRNLGILTNRQGSLTEKLSSGYRINRAADDAAGLKISEKMRGQIRGLRQASKNAQDGISMLQTADGALNEVHSMLQRVRELSVEAANDTNTSVDRLSMQEEIDQLLEEIDRITGQTEFNTRKIFDGSMAAKTDPYIVRKDEVYQLYGANKEFTATQSASGGSSVGSYSQIANVLDKEIVPHAVNALLHTYSDAFGYLSDSSTGIGLKIENNPSSQALASVSLSLSTGYGGVNPDGTFKYDLAFQLTVNVAYLDMASGGNLTDDSRRELETTVLHEMVHGIMDEALTNGMLGFANGVHNTSYEYPNWFVEGMAQTASGGFADNNDWVNGGLDITASTSEDSISRIVKLSTNKLSNTSNAEASYGTGYLACMYLGQLASGNGLEVEDISASSIKSGLNNILKRLVGGASLDTAIKEATGGAYTSCSNLESKFGDANSAKFIYNLTQIVGSGNGSLVTGSLSSVDLLPNSESSSTLLDLNPSTSTVTNSYPEDVTVLSGGSKAQEGPAPVEDYGTEQPTPSTGGDRINVTSLNAGTGNGYTFDGTTLRISGSGDYSISGMRSGISIVVDDGVTAVISMDGLRINSSGTTLTVGNGSDVTLNISGTNQLTGGNGAGINVKQDGTLTIAGTGKINASAGSGSGAAGIGGLAGETCGIVNIQGDSGKELVVTVKGDGGASGTGAGKGATGGTINKSCGIVIDSSSNTGTVSGNVAITDKLDTKGASLSIDKGATLSISSSGSIVSGSQEAQIDVYGTVENHGNIGDKLTTKTEGGTRGQIKHYASALSMTEPEEISAGSKLLATENSSASVTYNGNKETIVTANWIIKDSSGNVVNNPASVNAEEGKTYTYSVTYELSKEQITEGILFSPSTVIDYNFKHLNRMEQFHSAESGSFTNESENVRLQTREYSKDGHWIKVTYDVTPTAESTGGAESGGSSGGGDIISSTNGFMIQAGANSGQGIALDIDEINTTELGLHGLSVMSYEEASKSISLCDDAINKVSSVRSRIGAYQNRLEYTIENLDNTAENLQTAESRIRDLDMASAMVEYAKNQILIQAAQAMIVQANQNPRGILQLLQ